jgi:predicted RND superfamily exporter protein
VRALATLSARRPLVVLGLTILVGVAAGLGISRVKKEEDLMVFLPTRDPDVQRFQEVCRRFGALRVALVGVEVAEGHDVLEADVIGKIGRASDTIRNLTGVDRVLSLTTIADVVSGEGGAEITTLVAGPPADAAAHEALRQKVLSRDHVVGNVVSADARAALLLVFLAEPKAGQVPAERIEDRIRAAATAELTGLSLTFGGAPFAGRAIYTEAQQDVWRLSPVALAVLLLVVLVAFRDPIGVALTLASVAYALVIVVGAMGWLGEHWTVATSTLPVILFASGSSYAVHVLGRYYLIRTEDREIGGPPAMAEAIGIVAAPLAIAALTTSVGFFSFVVTDVRPMRAFGLACGAGVLLCWVASLTMVPAVIALLPRRRARPLELRWLGDAIVWLWRACERRRGLALFACGLIALLLVPPSLRVRVRMEPRAFFRKGSDPERAERFLVERFGGATFVQVAVKGPFDEPAALRELARLDDYARSLPGVTQVQSIVAPLLLVSDAMGAGKRLPTTPGQARNLYFFLQGAPEVRSLLVEDRKEVLVHVRVAAHAEAVVAALERYAQGRLAAPHGWPSRDEVGEHLALILTRPGRKSPDLAAIKRATRVLDLPTTNDEELLRRGDRIAHAAIAAPEAPELRPERKAEVELGVERRTPGWRDAWRAAALHPEDVEVAADALERDLRAARRQLGVERALLAVVEGSGVGELSDAQKNRVLRTLDDLFGADEAAVAPAALQAEVAGEPVLDRGFSAAVERNQVRSLLIAVGAVLVFLLALFRRWTIAVICMAPALLTLIYQTGLMGLSGASVDLGTSLVAGIATGAGSDFAMHYLWYLRRQDSDEVSRSVGPVMVVSVALVAVGFFVLGLGRSPVMHLFGALAGGAMALSALLSVIVLPAALGGRRP